MTGKTHKVKRNENLRRVLIAISIVWALVVLFFLWTIFSIAARRGKHLGVRIKRGSRHLDHLAGVATTVFCLSRLGSSNDLALAADRHATTRVIACEWCNCAIGLRWVCGLLLDPHVQGRPCSNNTYHIAPANYSLKRCKYASFTVCD